MATVSPSTQVGFVLTWWDGSWHPPPLQLEQKTHEAAQALLDAEALAQQRHADLVKAHAQEMGALEARKEELRKHKKDLLEDLFKATEVLGSLTAEKAGLAGKVDDLTAEVSDLAIRPVDCVTPCASSLTAGQS